MNQPIAQMIRLLVLASMLLPAWHLAAQDDSTAQEEVSPPAYLEENKECLKCHGHKYFSYFNETVGREIKERMNPYYVVDSALFYHSNHRNFQLD